MAVVLGGSFMVVLDTTVLGVVLPSIAHDLDAGDSVDWVVTSYLIAVGLAQPATGWMADRFGKKHVYMGALATFVLGSTLAAAAPNLPLLLAARLLQGVGGGAMQPVGMAMIYELFPADRRGTALGWWGVAIMAAPAIGPPFGGWVATVATWRWIFLLNIPIGLLALILAHRLLRERSHRDERSLDWIAWAIGATGVIAVVVAARLAPQWGLGSARTISVLTVGAVLIVTLVLRSVRSPNPLLRFELFGVPTFAISMGLVALLTTAQYGRLIFLPMELQSIRGLGADEVGLLLAPAALGVAVSMPIGGRLADRIGARIPVFVGLGLVAHTTWFLANLTVETSLRDLVVVLVIGGFGTGLAIMPNTVAAMNSLPTPFVAQAATLRSLTRQIAGALGTAALGALLVAQLGGIDPSAAATGGDAQAAFNTLFLATFWVMVGTMVFALFLPGRRRTQEHQRARAAEQADIVGDPEV
jgi:EmrB/QacA subfamily drug resistance transporter